MIPLSKTHLENLLSLSSQHVVIALIVVGVGISIMLGLFILLPWVIEAEKEWETDHSEVSDEFHYQTHSKTGKRRIIKKTKRHLPSDDDWPKIKKA